MCVNAWSPAGFTVIRRYGLVGDVSLGKFQTTPFPVPSLCLLLVDLDMSSQLFQPTYLLLAAMLPRSL